MFINLILIVLGLYSWPGSWLVSCDSLLYDDQYKINKQKIKKEYSCMLNWTILNPKRWCCESAALNSVQFSCSVMSDSLWPHELQHARPPHPSPTPRAYPNSCPLSQWYHPTISSSVVPFSSWPQSFLRLIGKRKFYSVFYFLTDIKFSNCLQKMRNLKYYQSNYSKGLAFNPRLWVWTDRQQAQQGALRSLK